MYIIIIITTSLALCETAHRIQISYTGFSLLSRMVHCPLTSQTVCHPRGTLPSFFSVDLLTNCSMIHAALTQLKSADARSFRVTVIRCLVSQNSVPIRQIRFSRSFTLIQPQWLIGRKAPSYLPTVSSVALNNRTVTGRKAPSYYFYSPRLSHLF